MATQTKNSVMAIVRETTEGTPVAPSGTSYIALQDGFSVEGAFEKLENAELTGSIGAAKSIQGFESPTASVSHYIRHSGVEGTEPNFGLLLEAAFGAKVVASTQYDTVAASTVSTIKVDTGEGVNFQRGQGLLIKDGTNGYKIRPILSVSGDDLTLGFKLPTGGAPASGVNLGKCVLYKPANTDHPTMSVWDYRGNGGAVQMMAGARVTELGIQASAGELINGTFSMAGIRFYFNPIEIAATDTKLDFLDNVTTRVATIQAKMYRDPIELADALASAMNSLGSANTFTVTYSSSTGKYTIASNGTTLSLLWSTGANAANTIGDKLGYLTAADDTGSLTYLSDNAQSLVAPHTPAFDNSNPLVAKDNQILLGDASDADPACVSVSQISMSLTDEKTDILSICAESGKSGSLVTARSVTIDLVATLSTYDVEKFKRFRSSQTTSFMWAFGSKAGGNFEAGKSGYLYMPTAVIETHNLSDTDGIVSLEMTLKAFVQSGAGEVYLGFL
jgi:hypothetical protein